MTHLLCFDPGETTGVAWFVDHELSRAWATKFEELIKSPPRGFDGQQADVVIEQPQWRPRDRVDINDLIKLALKTGELRHYYRSHAHVVLVVPTTWKGSVPKGIHNERVLRALTPAELARVPRRPRARTPDHNAVDAIGLGLWKLGRMR